jgi:hypothetical protein
VQEQPEALHGYNDTHGVMPPGVVNPGVQPRAAFPYTQACAEQCRNAPFSLLVLPHLDQGPLYNSLSFSLPMGSAQRSGTGPATNQGDKFTVTVPVFQCPSDNPFSDPHNVTGQGAFAVANARRASYWFPVIDRLEDRIDNCAAMYRQDASSNKAMFGVNGACRLDQVKDGTTNTFMLVETPFRKNSANYGPFWNVWAYTGGVEISNPMNPMNGRLGCGGGAGGCPMAWGFGSAHEGGMHACLADGSVRFVSENTLFSVLQSLTTIAKTEVVPEF